MISFCFLLVSISIANAGHRSHRDLDFEQQQFVWPSDDKGFGQKTEIGQPKGKGTYQNRFRPSPSLNTRSDNPTCSLVTTDGEGVFTCVGDFPSASQLKGIECLNVTNANLDALIYSKYIESAKLKRLLLDDCKITSIQKELFLTTSHLQELDLSKNKLAIVRTTTFKGLTKLKTLKLAENEIALIEPGSFDTNQCLEHLDLSHNQLTEFPAGLPTSLVHLLLSGNRIQQITVPIALPHVIEIDLCMNKITEMPSVRCPALTKLCISAFNLNWDSTSLDSSSLDSLREVSFYNHVEDNIFPTNVLQFLQGKLIHRLTIQDYIINELYLPTTLTHLSLIEVKVKNEGNINSLIPCASKLVYLDLSHSKELAGALVTNTEVLGELKQLKLLILTACGIHTLGWLGYPGYFPMLTQCDISQNALDCGDEATKRVLCKKEREETMTKLILHSTTCTTGAPWDYSLCTVTNPPTNVIPLVEPRVVPPVSQGAFHQTPDESGALVHDETWKTWIIVVSAVAALLVVLTIVLVTCYMCKKKSNKYGEVSTSEDLSREAQPMLKKGSK